MDDNLDWQGRPLPLEHPFSYEGWMRANFYDPIDPELAIPEEQRHFPSIYDIDGISKKIEEIGLGGHHLRRDRIQRTYCFQ